MSALTTTPTTSSTDVAVKNGNGADVEMRDSPSVRSSRQATPPQPPQPSLPALAPPPASSSGTADRVATQPSNLLNPLMTLAQLDAKVADAAKTLQYRIDGKYVELCDPFENKTSRAGLHKNQRRWRHVRITHNAKALLTKESRIRTLADVQKRLSDEQTETTAKLKTLAVEHARLTRETGTLKLLALVDSRYDRERKSATLANDTKRERLQQLSDEYRAKRRRLSGLGSAAATTNENASATDKPVNRAQPPMIPILCNAKVPPST